MPGEFTLLKKTGHYYWRENKSGRIVVTDESADHGEICPGNPHNTDDGVLYLDVDKLQGIAMPNIPSLLPVRGYIIPVLDPDGRSFSMSARLAEFVHAINFANSKT